MILKKYISPKRSGIFTRNIICVCVVLLGAFSSCDSDKIEGDSYYTFTGETVASFCEKDARFTIFNRLIRETGNYSLLSVYGHFTCFAPTDAAFNTYFAENKTSYDALSASDKTKLLYNHIIRGESFSYTSDRFQEGMIGNPNMRDRYIGVSLKNNSDGSRGVIINTNCTIIEYNNELHNGVLHVLDRVIVLSEEDIPTVIKNDPNNQFSIFSEAMQVTKLGDKIQGIYNENYKSPYPNGYVNVDGWNFKVPDRDKLGYTVFCETDEVFNRAGITDLASLREYAAVYYGREDWDDYTSSKNPVHQFVAYHMLNRNIATNSFIYQGFCTTPIPEIMDQRYEFYETMLKNRLMEIKPSASGYKINTSTSNDAKCVMLDEAKSNINCVNGLVHTLRDILVYDESFMTGDVLNKRIRFDSYSIPPQMTNNNIRWKLLEVQGFGGYSVTPDFCGEYLTFNDASTLKLWASEGWTNYQADEMVFKGWYDFTIRMLPVPPGTYEIRLGYKAEFWRGIAQLFVDNEIQGIPVNLRILGTDPGVGWIADKETNDNGLENDKSMRNRGYMKAPASIYSRNGPKTLRDDPASLRIVVGTFTFQEYAPHYLRIKNVETNDREFHFDYIEYIPTNLIETEDVN